MYKCERAQPDTPLLSTKVTSDLSEAQINDTSGDAKERLVVKVCDTSDIGVHQSALNEHQILKELERDTIMELVAFYEDPLINRTYLVSR